MGREHGLVGTNVTRRMATWKVTMCNGKSDDVQCNAKSDDTGSDEGVGDGKRRAERQGQGPAAGRLRQSLGWGCARSRVRRKGTRRKEAGSREERAEEGRTYKEEVLFERRRRTISKSLLAVVR